MEALNELESGVTLGWRHCTNCGAISPLVSELCLNCLLRDACDDSANVSEANSLDDIFTLLDVGDASWRFGDYEILREIGRGGMAVVYKARESHTQRLVALKRVIAGRLESKEGLARFRREAETAARLHHPNIVPVYFVGQSADRIPFFTMKMAKRGSLQQARRELRHQFQRCVNVMTKVAHAVHYAHNQGVLHRDLKPGNILLDEEWEPLVSDFGLARSQNASSGLTRTFTTFGTPSYVAPEQATGPSTKLTAAADVYSLGAILFELLAGRPPFCGENPLAVIHEAAKRPAPKVRQFAADVDRDLEIICAHCLEREPSARYQSADELAQDLGWWLQDAPIVARAPTVRHRFTGWTRRNRTLAGVLGVALVFTAASFVWHIHTWRMQSAGRESILAAHSVLVMPFFDLDNLRSDPALAKSIGGSLQAELGRLGPARVRTMEPGSSGGWSGIEEVQKAGKAAFVRAVLTGTVRTVEGKNHISVRLLGAATGEPLFAHHWDESIEKDATKAVPENVGRTIYATLSANDWSKLLESKTDAGLRNNSSKEIIIAGRELLSRYKALDFDRAITLFKKATQIEPKSALAHSYLAIAATSRTHYISDRSFLELGKEAARKAIQLAPDSSDAHRALAGVYYQ
jgi:serine/threonine protein kinase